MFHRLRNYLLSTSLDNIPAHPVLLIGQQDDSWTDVLRAAVTLAGRLAVSSEVSVLHQGLIPLHTLYVIDATHVKDVVAVIVCIRQAHPAARLLVADTNPLWQNTRAALRAGAIDYIQREHDSKALQRVIIETLQKHIPLDG